MLCPPGVLTASNGLSALIESRSEVEDAFLWQQQKSYLALFKKHKADQENILERLERCTEFVLKNASELQAEIYMISKEDFQISLWAGVSVSNEVINSLEEEMRHERGALINRLRGKQDILKAYLEKTKKKFKTLLNEEKTKFKEISVQFCPDRN